MVFYWARENKEPRAEALKGHKGTPVDQGFVCRKWTLPTPAKSDKT